MRNVDAKEDITSNNAKRILLFCPMRYFLDLSYDGTDYHGWQVQKNANSIQAEVEKAIGIILQDKCQVTGSGRTDTGVHARQQIAHLDVDQSLNPGTFIHKLNSLLPHAIAMNALHHVQDEANARFDAIMRSYVYRIHRRKDPFLVNRSYHFRPELDVVAIRAAATKLLDRTDFECFSKVKTDVNHFHCTIHSAEWHKTSTGYEFQITANRFLRGMVRAIVGTLLEVGQNKLSLPEFDLVLQGGNRSEAGTAVPPHGLYLSQVQYPEKIFDLGGAGKTH